MAPHTPDAGQPPGTPHRLQRWRDLSYYFGEYLTMALVPRHGPGPVMRWAFTFPVWLYRVGLGGLVSHQVLLLTTRGRKSGRPHVTPLGYAHDPAADAYYLTAGWDGKTDWYRNARANPRVRVQVGKREFEAEAEPVPEATAMALLARYARRNPFAARMYQRWTGVPFDGSQASLRAAAARFPMMAVRPGHASGKMP